jgi:hypothetical protein
MWQNITAYKTDPVWLSWLALVAHETAAASDVFTDDCIEELDRKRIGHTKAFNAVDEYKDCTKPKHYLRANYPCDIQMTGPLVRTWCMSFEALIQVLKHIVENSNYKNVNERMVRIWAIRHGLLLHDDKLSRWSDDAVQLTSEPATMLYEGGELTVISSPKSFRSLSAFQYQVRACGMHKLRALQAHATRALLRARCKHVLRARCKRMLRARCMRMLRARCKHVLRARSMRAHDALRAQAHVLTRVARAYAFGLRPCCSCTHAMRTLRMPLRAGSRDCCCCCC